MSAYQEFVFDKYGYCAETGQLSLHYAYKNGPAFKEFIAFPLPPQQLTDEVKDAFDRACRLIFLLAGVSYYKAYIPSRISCPAFPLSIELADFCTKVYRLGLAEFAYRNSVTVAPVFPVSERQDYNSAPSLNFSKDELVPVGGGKDSIVTIEMLKRAGKNVTLFALGGDTLAQPIADTIETAKLPYVHVRRKLSPELIRINSEGALNGHVPITAILSAIAVATAILHRHQAVILSNESSANAPNVVCEGLEVNHQYSKSFAFEQDFKAIVRKTTCSNIKYFSILRPLTEVAIAKRFANCTAYQGIFRSCNMAFKQDEAKRGKKWCCNCPKCRFVFLALAPFIEKERLISIFGSNLLSDQSHMDGYKELCGLVAIKPFECVGEVEESRLLMCKLASSAEWLDDLVVQEIGKVLLKDEKDVEERFAKLFSLTDNHSVEPSYLEILNESV